MVSKREGSCVCEREREICNYNTRRKCLSERPQMTVWGFNWTFPSPIPLITHLSHDPSLPQSTLTSPSTLTPPHLSLSLLLPPYSITCIHFPFSSLFLPLSKNLYFFFCHTTQEFLLSDGNIKIKVFTIFSLFYFPNSKAGKYETSLSQESSTHSRSTLIKLINYKLSKITNIGEVLYRNWKEMKYISRP